MTNALAHKHRHLSYLLGLCMALAHGPRATADQTLLTKEMHHLRSGMGREWSSFPESADGPRLAAKFEVTEANKPQTLGLRRVDVKEDWRITINGRKLRDLASDENDMRELYGIPGEYLVAGNNEIVIEAGGNKLDDVMIGELWVDTKSKDELLNACTMQLQAVDESGQDTPCRFTILDEAGSMAAIAPSNDQQLAIRSGVVYTGTGKATVKLMPSKYTVHCGRGFEYEIEKENVEASPDQPATKKFTLHRSVDTSGYVACDTHSHTFEISRHGDASLVERMVTLAGEGIEVAVAADHNIFVDYGPTQRELGLQKYFKPIIGDEVTTKFGHFNAFAGSAAATLPDHTIADWPTLMKSIRDKAGLQFVIMNHPRDLHSNFRPFGPENMIAATGKRIDGRTLDVDAIELINSAALQSDPMVLFHDWMTQVNRGMNLHAVGSSDSHEVSMKIVGQGRTYIRIDDRDPASLQVPDIIAAMKAGRMLVSLGLMAEITVDDYAQSGDSFQPKRGSKDSVDIKIDIRGPSWAHVDVVELYGNGILLRTMSRDNQSAESLKQPIRLSIPLPKHDIQLVAVARGHSDAGLAWPIAKPYQPTSPDWKPYLFASSGIVRVECDGYGKWTGPNEHATDIVQQTNGDLAQAIKLLESYDVSTAAFFAEQWTSQHGSLREPAARKQWESASDKIRTGITNYLDSERASAQR